MAVDNGDPLSAYDRDLIALTIARGRPLSPDWARLLLSQIDHLNLKLVEAALKVKAAERENDNHCRNCIYMYGEEELHG